MRSGPTHLAAAHFAALGHIPPSPAVPIADFILDLVIKVRGLEKCNWFVAAQGMVSGRALDMRTGWLGFPSP